MASAAEKPRPITAASLARSAYQQAEDAAAAVDIMYERVMANPALKAQFEESAFRQWCNVTVNNFIHTQRVQTLPPMRLVEGSAPPKYSPAPGRTYSRQATTSLRTIYDTPMFGGKRLGDFYRFELLEQASREREEIATRDRTIRFAEAVANAMKVSDKRVEEALTEEQVKDIEKNLA